MAPSQTDSEPIVSVIIPAYQASGDIEDALASVFAQTFTSWRRG
jgi:glycosyltransferase involved in cell wall biosynthesis